VGKPIRVPRSSLVIEEELSKYVELAARQVGEDDGIFVLIDADDDAACLLGPKLLKVCEEARRDRLSRVVIAVREYESWFLAAAISLRGRRGLSEELTPPKEPEAIRDAKGWLSRHNVEGRSYKETLDQPALTAVFDIDAALAAPSFAKLYRDVQKLLRDTSATERAYPEADGR
jgi:hypothetical protein